MQTLLQRKNFCLLWTGAILSALGYVSLMGFSHVYDYMVKNALFLGPDSDAAKSWEKTKSPIPMKVFFYNWTNPQDIYNVSIKPHFEQVGPYVFKQVKEKVNVTWNENGTVSYMFRKSFYFDEEHSKGSMDDIINTINIVALTAAYSSRNWHFVWKSFTTLPLYSAQIYVTKTVSELTFEGYEDTLLTMKTILTFSDGNHNRFGWFYNRNGTSGMDGIYNIGKESGEKFGTLQEWNYSNRTSYYEGQCGEIRGSGGELFPTDRKRDQIELFSPELCRSSKFLYEKDVVIKGLNGFKYTFDIDGFDNGTKVQENQCFCAGECMPSGVLNATSCRGSPLYISLPHFYTADPIYIDSIEGLSPSKDKHEFFISLEPKTGVIIDIAARIQVNVLIQPIEGSRIFANAPKMIIPVFWFEQTVEVADDLVTPLWIIQNLPNINQIVSIVLIVIGLVLIAYVIFRVLKQKRENKNKYDEPKTEKTIIEEIPLDSN